MILAAGLARGLKMADADQMTLGMWVDYIIEYNNMTMKARKEVKKNEKQTTRRATQADFDRF